MEENLKITPQDGKPQQAPHFQIHETRQSQELDRYPLSLFQNARKSYFDISSKFTSPPRSPIHLIKCSYHPLPPSQPHNPHPSRRLSYRPLAPEGPATTSSSSTWAEANTPYWPPAPAHVRALSRTAVFWIIVGVGTSSSVPRPVW